MSNILILDAYNLMHRARFAFSKGKDGIVFGFLRTIRPIIEKHSPDKVYFVLEGYPKLNHELLDGEYKANRIILEDNPKYAEMQEFNRQKKKIIDIVENYLPFITIRHENMECDDTIQNIIVHEVSENDIATIVSTDSDFIQTLQKFSNVKLWHPIKKVFLDPPPYNYIIWKALRGDKTDNIPGLPRVGDKTAIKLISENRVEDFIIENNLQKDFERNLKLIELQTLENKEFYDENLLYKNINVKTNWPELRSKLTDMKLFSITNDTTWKKFIKTFEVLE